MEEKLTVAQVLEITVNILSRIQIPVTLTQSVGGPVMAAVNNLQQCLNAMKQTAPGNVTKLFAEGEEVGEVEANVDEPEYAEPEVTDVQVFGGKA